MIPKSRILSSSLLYTSGVFGREEDRVEQIGREVNLDFRSMQFFTDIICLFCPSQKKEFRNCIQKFVAGSCCTYEMFGHGYFNHASRACMLFPRHRVSPSASTLHLACSEWHGPSCSQMKIDNVSRLRILVF